MNSKMATNSQLSTTEAKKTQKLKLSKQLEQEQNHRNGEANELICTTHAHELQGENAGERRCAGWRGIKRGKWDNCNSIINKIHF